MTNYRIDSQCPQGDRGAFKAIINTVMCSGPVQVFRISDGYAP